MTPSKRNNPGQLLGLFQVSKRFQVKWDKLIDIHSGRARELFPRAEVMEIICLHWSLTRLHWEIIDAS